MGPKLANTGPKSDDIAQFQPTPNQICPNIVPSLAKSRQTDTTRAKRGQSGQVQDEFACEMATELKTISNVSATYGGYQVRIRRK